VLSPLVWLVVPGVAALDHPLWQCLVLVRILGAIPDDVLAADPALPHSDFPKKEIKCMWSLLSPFYFTNRICLHRPGALMVSMSVMLDGFSRVVMIFVFNSWCKYYFCVALTSVFTAFLCVFGYFLLPIGILFCLMFFIFTWYYTFWMIKNSIN